ncbi:hypothetical protein I5M32_11890 [Pedobacter sp. SD-b]|uniref:Carbohydrate-binding domain-containing protein n=1 Tax=Pedobacter segetis TaxID=2793069 RepID=A0ABS1BL93_9SPHI|nr:carbohydrate-binding family 9-like protein [Pedobacter segetis]MBK0383660.1 hypothetical protein [Pedobacter segetis]
MNKPILIPYILPNSFTDKKVEANISYAINSNAWDYKFAGKANFEIAYTDDALLVKFDVIEENILAIYNQPNDPVYKDSCVELFIALDNDQAYYNFEFNCKGTCLAGFGESKENRKLLDAKNIRNIRANSSFKSVIFEDKKMIKWELQLEIPKSVFQFHQIESFKRRAARLNLYKCGDDLPEPHFLSWRPIKSETPNFHLPEFFGNAVFE